ncbi:MAG: ATP-binding protein [Bacteriovoracaceae bacterium]
MKKSVIIDTKNHLKLIEDYLIDSTKSPIEVCQSSFFKRSKYRVTLIQQNGTVLCDNKKQTDNMHSHKDRPEIQEALLNGEGSSIRYSQTLNEELIYQAKRISYENEFYFLRLSIALAGLNKALARIDTVIISIFTPIFILFSLIIIYFSIKTNFPLKSILQRLNRIKKYAHIEQFEPVVGDTNDWSLLENTLVQTEQRIKNYTDEIYLENEKLNKVLRSISDPIVAINEEQRILFANNPFKKTFRQTNQDEVQGSKLIEVLRALDGEEVFEKSLEVGKTIRSESVIAKPIKDNETLYFDLTVTPLKGPQKEIVGAVGVFRDITDTKKNAQIREEFVTNVGHEVKTPLTAMKGYFQLLRGQLKSMPTESHEIFDKIDRNIERLGNLFSDILNLSVIESKTNIDKSLVDTETLTSLVISNIRQNYPKKDIHIKTIFEAKQVYAHPLWIEQILTNLIDNAFKYGSSSTEVSISWSTKNNDSILIVSDNGPGIAEDHLPRLFERFYRADASRSRELGGTGLGLAIVKHIVNKHKGSIKVSSELDKGTEFIISLPKK